MKNNELQLEYGVRFDVKTGGANATAEIEALSKSWQALLDKQKLVIKMGAEAEKYSMGNTTEAKAQSSAAESDRNKQAKQLKELSAYYKELSDRARDFYNANQSDKNAALDGMKKRLEQIKKEMADIEYNLIGITDKKKPRADTTLQLNWIEDLKKEAAGIQAAMASLSNLNMGGAPANVQKLNSELTTTNFTLLQMREYYKQVEAENAKLAKNALSKTNTKDVLGMKEGSIDEIEKKIQRLNQSMQIFSNTASKVGMNDEKLNGAFRTANEELNRLTQKLATLQSGFGNRSLNSLLQINPKSIQEANVLMAELARRRDALNRTDPGYANSISAINKKQAELSAENARALGISEQKTKAINNETAAFDKQSTVISNLRNMAATYISLYEAGRLIKNIATVTGEFEKQEKSLAAIIKDADKANEIFGQVKNLAVVSPFKFGDLLSYTKQLAAYRIETDTLYDTMKNLADVSAGLGVDMSRIILAYGQVSAASVLRGQELRQFTEAGIPLVALLADKFSELEGRVVSTGEVFGKISERMVSFEMVKDIFADMSGEGGMFYNMQEIQAETLAGKISNLTDAYQIMFASIGGDETLNGILKGSIDLVTKLARNWREVWDVMKLPLTLFTGYKAGLLLMSGVQAAQAGIYAKNMAMQQASIGLNDKEVASLARKTAFQEASLAVSKGKIASDTIMNFSSAQTIAMDKREIVSKSIKLAVIKAGSDATKVANLQNEISIILSTAGVSKDRAAAMARLGLAVATNTATAATITFGSTVKAIWAISPIGWALAIVAAISSVVYWLTAGNRAAKAFREELSKIENAGTNESMQLSGRFKTLSETARDSTKSLKEQNDALSTLKQVYGDILPDYMLTIQGLIDIGDNYDRVTAAIEANIAVKTKEKKMTAISDNFQEKTNPVVDGLKRDLGDIGLDAVLAGKAIDELQKRINEGTVTKKNPYLELMQIIKDLNGTEFNPMGRFVNKNLNEIKSGTADLTTALLEQKNAIEELNKTPPKFYEAFAAKAAAIAGEVKKATESIIKGEKKDDTGKIVVFDESIYQFNERKANVERESLIKHIEATTGKAFEAVQSSMAKNGGKDMNLNFGVLNWLEDSIKRVSELDTSPVQKRVNEIIERTAKLQGVGASQYDAYAYKGISSDGGNGFETILSEYDSLKKKIQETKDANKDWATDITIKAKDVAGGFRQITKEEYLNGYKDGDKEVAGLNEKLAVINAIREAFGLIDKDAKKSGGASTVNPRIAAIQAEIDLVIQAKKKYEELVKSGIGDPESKKIVDNLYKDQFKLKYETGDKKGQIIFKTVIDEKGLIGELKTAKSEFKKIPKTEQPVFQVGLKINESEIKIFTDEMKAKLSEIEKEFATNKKRIDLFDTIFDVTGDFGIASKIAESINGAGTTDIEVALSNAFKKSMDAIEIGIDTKQLFDKNGNIDIKASQAVIDKMTDSDPKKEAQKQLDIVKEFKSKEYIELLKGLEDFKTYEKKRADIISDGLRERNKILADNTLTPEEQDKLVSQSVKKQGASLSKNSMEQFKGSETWASAFGDMDLVSAPVLERLKEDLIKFREENKDLPITELKELTKTIEDLQKRTSNITFGEFIKAFTTDYKIPELIEKLDEAKKKVKLLQEAQNDAESAKVDAETNYTKVAKQNGGDANNPLVKAAYSAVVDASKNAAKATEDYTAAVKDAEVSEKDLTTAQNARIKATKAAITANQGTIEGFTLIKSAVESSVSAFYAMADAIGITINPETKAILDGLTKGLTAIIAVLGAVAVYLEIVAFAATQAGIAFFAMMAPFWPIIAALALITAGFAIFKAIKLNGINDQLDEQKKIVEGLQEQYAELERKIGDALGTDWLTKYNQQLVNTQKQIKSLGKQIELEKSKGKDASPEDLKSFEDALAAQRIIAEEQSSKLQNFVSGTDLASAASDFATAWLDAYKSFGNTSEAMKDKFKDMINSMVVNTLLAKAMEIALRPVFTAMENASKTDSAGGAAFTSEEIAGIVAETTKSTANADANMTLLMDRLKQAGIDVRESSTNLTGLSKGISGITEDTALLLGGYLDSIRFRIFAYFDAMAAIPTFDMKSSMATLMTAQNTQISHLEGIKSNTLRSAIASENLSAKIDSVVAVSTAGTGYALRVNA